MVHLDEYSILKKSVTVTGNIEANELIKRAIARKEDNLNKLKTFKGRLYSKMNIELGGSVFAQSQGGNSVNLGIQTKTKENPELYRLFLLETFSDVYKDYTKDISYTNIIQRKQTANIPDSANIMAMSKFINLYDDYVTIINTRIATPLSKDAFDYYKFKIIKKEIYDDKYLYSISVIPATTLFPAFQGTIKLLEGDYNLIEAILEPSKNTAISFVDSLLLTEKYNESVEGVWYPSFLELSGKVNVEIIKKLFEIKADLKATSIYSDVEINKPLPDSIYAQENKSILTVARNADSSKTDFWENNSLREITKREKKIYKKIDSLVVVDSTRKVEAVSVFDWNLMPYLDFNRVNSVSLGIQPGFQIFNTGLEGFAAYSFGMKRIVWDANIFYKFEFPHRNYLKLGIKSFDKPTRISLDRSYSRLLNTVFAGLFHFDYYDYLRSNGYEVFADVKIGNFFLNSGFEFSQQTSLPKTTNNSIFSKKIWRENPEISEGNFTVFSLDAQIGNVSFLLAGNSFENEFQLNSVLGKNTDNNNNIFYSFFVKYKTGIPLIQTGYRPIKLYMSLEGGLSTTNVPFQYLNRMQSAMKFITNFGNFMTAEPAEFGGYKYFGAHAILQLSDLWWRFLHLPLYEGRGPSLNIGGSLAKFSSDGESIYRSTDNNFYSEIGFGLSRIPTFVSNVVYLAANVRWGIGPIASGRFNWALSISLPF